MHSEGRPAPDEPDRPAPEPRRRPYWVHAALAVAAVALLGSTAYHLGTVFLSIAPPNPVSQRYQNQISAHVDPEFEQNWQLFAPNPLHADVRIQARVQTLAPDGTRTDSDWIDLTARDLAHIRHNPAPSHIDQNQLRRAWDVYVSWHSPNGEAPIGLNGQLTGGNLKRIALQRLGRSWHGRPIVQLRLRAATSPLTGPAWTQAQSAGTARTTYRTLPWWPVADSDYQGLGVATS